MNEKDIQKAREILSCDKCSFRDKSECANCFDMEAIINMAHYKNEQVENLVKSLNYEYFKSFSEVEDFIINTICGTDTP
jgi:hypothetical protein